MKFINCTPHKIVVNTDGGFIEIEPSGQVARISQTNEVVSVIDGIKMFKTKYGDGVNIPEPQSDTLFIVSTVVKNAYPERNDLVVPTEFVRDDKGNIIACGGFAL